MTKDRLAPTGRLTPLRRRSLVGFLGAVLFFLVTGIPQGVVFADTTSGTVDFSVRGNLLSVQIDQASLREVLGKLARQIPLTVTAPSSVLQDRVSMTFTNVPLEEGIERILQGRQFALISTRSSDTQGRPTQAKVLEIVVLDSADSPSPRASLETLASSPIPVHRPTPKFLQEEVPLNYLKWEALQAWDSDTRLAALEKLSERGDEGEVLETLATALQDEAPEIRAAALELLEDNGESLPSAPVARMAREDDNPELRMQALEVLGELEPEIAVGPLTQALQDSDPEVRELATELLEDLRALEKD